MTKKIGMTTTADDGVDTVVMSESDLRERGMWVGPYPANADIREATEDDVIPARSDDQGLSEVDAIMASVWLDPIVSEGE